MSSFSNRYGPWAVVTGAAAGVGLAFTEELIHRGIGVVMVDMAPEVAAVAERLEGATRSLVADVSDPGWIDALDEAVSGIEIGLAVANAGAAYVGHYLNMDAATRRRIVTVNCEATADLASWALPPMVERSRGGLVVMSSGSALAGTAGVALYSATKAFGINLAEALGWELRHTGVDTLAIVGPSMDTPTFRAAQPDFDRMLAPMVDPRTVVSGGLDALPQGGRWLADEGLELAATVERHQRVDLLSATTTAMYPATFE